MNEDIIKNLLRHAIGYDPLYTFAETANKTNYPPHDVLITGENRYRLVLAVAGFSEEQLSVQLERQTLIVSGTEAEVPAEFQYAHKGIASRAFSRQFKLGEHIQVVDAHLQNGLLVIDLERLVPDADKPRRIEISRKTARKEIESASVSS